jgi:hypothetical protein
MGGFENDVMLAKNMNFDPAAAKPHLGIINSAGKLPIGTGNTSPIPEILAGSLTSPLGTLSIGYASPNITIDLMGGGEGIDSIAVQTGTSPVVPTAGGLVTINGAVVAAGTNPVRSDGTGVNTLAIEVQISQAIAAADATKIGLCNFDSNIFTVAATGFVSTSGGTLVQSITGGPGITITGTAAVPIINSVIFTDTTAATLAVDNGYFATAAGTYPLPATAAQGEMLIVVCDTAGAVVLDAPALNFIRIGSAITSSGGTVTSNAIGDSLTLRYRLSTLTWEATSVIGTWTTA